MPHTIAPPNVAPLVARRVVTLADVAGRTSTEGPLVVGHRAIITPAARDYLRARKIEVLWSVATPQIAASQTPLVLGANAPRFELEGLVTAARRQRSVVEAHRQLATPTMIGSLTTTVARGGDAFLVTHEAPLAMCLAARQPGVRPLWAVDRRRLRTDMAAIGANLLVVDPAGLSFYAVQQLLEEFLRTERVCPETLK